MQKTDFKPFDSVLTRDNDKDPWIPDIFLLYREEVSFPYTCARSIGRQCIPYEGNEALAGTTDKPEQEINDCPLCGCQARVQTVLYSNTDYCVRCASCGLSGPVAAVKDDAIARWNKLGVRE